MRGARPVGATERGQKLGGDGVEEVAAAEIVGQRLDRLERGPRTAHLAERDGAVESRDRRRRQTKQQVIEDHDL